jgi:transposase
MLSSMKTRERDLARHLRKVEGASVKEIAECLGVSKSSVSPWVRDIAPNEAQIEPFGARNPAFSWFSA